MLSTCSHVQLEFMKSMITSLQPTQLVSLVSNEIHHSLFVSLCHVITSCHTSCHYVMSSCHVIASQPLSHLVLIWSSSGPHLVLIWSSPGPPGPVSDITSMLAGLTAVKVSWQPPKGEIMNIISYSVEVTCRGKSFHFSNGTASRSVTVDGLPNNTTCIVNISATNNNGSGPVATYRFPTASPGERMFVW